MGAVCASPQDEAGATSSAFNEEMKHPPLPLPARVFPPPVPAVAAAAAAPAPPDEDVAPPTLSPRLAHPTSPSTRLMSPSSRVRRQVILLDNLVPTCTDPNAPPPLITLIEDAVYSSFDKDITSSPPAAAEAEDADNTSNRL